MAEKVKSITLKATEAGRRDVGRGIARLDPEDIISALESIKINS